MNLKGLAKYKKKALQDALLVAIPLDHGLNLIPIGEWLLSENRETIEKFRGWRAVNSKSFFSEILPSTENFESYLLNGPIGNHQKILFAIYRKTSLLGHIGLSNFTGKSASLDNVIKSPSGEGESRIDVMGISIEGLLAWGASNLGINLFELVVRSDNLRAINLYSRVGFELRETLSLRVTQIGPHIEYVNSSLAESNTSVRKLVFQKSYPNSLT